MSDEGGFTGRVRYGEAFSMIFLPTGVVRDGELT
jgi:hypothetical protein